MASMTIKRTMATALAGAAVAAASAAPAAWSMPADPVQGTGDRGESVAPPPSSIAVSAADDYAVLRSAAAKDGPLTIAEPEPVVAETAAPDGFDLPSAAIGAAGGGLIIVVLAAGGLALRRVPTRRHGAAGA